MTTQTLPDSKMVTLDVREDFRSGLHPCDKIMASLEQVNGTTSLRLLVPFEPAPLFQVAREKGLRHQARLLSTGDWEVLFALDPETAEPPVTGPAAGDCGGSAATPTRTLELDARGLEPPQPMVRILEALAALPDGAELNARTDRRPIHLYPQLAQRGFRAASEQQPDGSFITYIRRG
jgi:TusA-related sulfurtransferase